MLGLIFFKKAALSLDHLLEPDPERLAHLDDVGLGQGPPVLGIGDLLSLHTWVGGLTGLGLQNAPYQVVQRVEVRTGQGPHVLGPESGQARRQPLLGPFRGVGWGPVLLEEVIAIWIVLAKPGDQMTLQKSNVGLCVDLEAGRDEDGRAGLAVGGGRFCRWR